MNNFFDRMLRNILVGTVMVGSLAGCEEELVQRSQTPPRVPIAIAQTVTADMAPPAPVPMVAVATPEPVELDPDIHSQWADIMGASRAALAKGQVDKGRKLAVLATKKGGNRSASWNLLGRAQLKKGERGAAIASFEKAVELNPESSYAHNNLGLALIYAERFDEAVEELEDATDCMPVEGYMWNNLGMAYEHLDRLAEARDAYSKADEMEVPRARQNLARLQGVKSIKTAANDVIDPEVIENQGGEAFDGAGGL